MKLSRNDFERLAIEQLDTLYRFARRLTRDQNRAEDLVQETYVRALKGRDNFDLQEFGIRPWLLRILYNLHLSKGERDARQPVSMGDEHLEMAEAMSFSPPLGMPIDPKSYDGMDERLVRALDGLQDEYRSVLMLWAVEDFAYKEIAEALGIPIGTVMSRLYRARQKLTEQLQEFAVEERIIRNNATV